MRPKINPKRGLEQGDGLRTLWLTFVIVLFKIAIRELRCRKIEGKVGVKC